VGLVEPADLIISTNPLNQSNIHGSSRKYFRPHDKKFQAMERNTWY